MVYARTVTFGQLCLEDIYELNLGHTCSVSCSLSLALSPVTTVALAPSLPQPLLPGTTATVVVAHTTATVAPLHDRCHWSCSFASAAVAPSHHCCHSCCAHYRHHCSLAPPQSLLLLPHRRNHCSLTPPPP